MGSQRDLGLRGGGFIAGQIMVPYQQVADHHVEWFACLPVLFTMHFLLVRNVEVFGQPAGPGPARGGVIAGQIMVPCR